MSPAQINCQGLNPFQSIHHPGQASELFSNHLLKHLFVKGQIGDELLEASIFFSDLLEFLHLRG